MTMLPNQEIQLPVFAAFMKLPSSIRSEISAVSPVGIAVGNSG